MSNQLDTLHELLSVNSNANNQVQMSNEYNIAEKFEKMDLNNEQSDNNNSINTSSYRIKQIFGNSAIMHTDDSVRLNNDAFSRFNQIADDPFVYKDIGVLTENEKMYNTRIHYSLNPYIPSGKHLEFSSIDEIYNTIRQIERCFPYLNIIEAEPFGRSERFDPMLTANFTKEIIYNQDNIVSKFSKIYKLQSQLKEFCIVPIDWHDRLLAIIDNSFNEGVAPIYASNYQELLENIYYDGQKLSNWGKLLVVIFHPHQIEYETCLYINNLISSSTIEPNTSAHRWALDLCFKLNNFYNIVPFKQLFFKIYKEFEKRNIEFGFYEIHENCNSIKELTEFLIQHADGADGLIRV
ncbi:unnamed protein product [[Candida] boidinii]|uniref:Unnamed protein product n=1 Tax=Candida boidinii TaxID=5477 RepID=A0A9W6T2X8_CANBO|nr:hypothetical protein B5S30_g2671 [[Candida] boidinii]GME74539.1 unnamed protein product [[Candida] boidinii]GMG18511.1 unnamed protein product [[Candida] boidinii]